MLWLHLELKFTAPCMCSIISSAEEFASSVLKGFGAKFEGWGQTASASYEVSTEMAFSQRSVIASVQRKYISSPIIVIKPSVVKVTDPPSSSLKAEARLKDAASSALKVDARSLPCLSQGQRSTARYP